MHQRRQVLHILLPGVRAMDVGALARVAPLVVLERKRAAAALPAAAVVYESQCYCVHQLMACLCQAVTKHAQRCTGCLQGTAWHQAIWQAQAVAVTSTNLGNLLHNKSKPSCAAGASRLTLLGFSRVVSSV